MTDCVFCSIVAGDEERSLVYEDERCVVIADLMPVNQGHVLVIPKEHSERVAELGEELAAHLFAVARRAASALLRSGLRCDGVNFWISDGEAAGQEVPHVHVHVLPRYFGDRFRVLKEGDWSVQARDELDEAARKVSSAWR